MDSTSKTTQQEDRSQQTSGLGQKIVDAADSVASKFAPYQANPGPVVAQNINDIPEEGTKEERMAKAKELNQ
ncbi:hypothetical protein P8C59_009340 [Phyllachora maydis]|uniref:Uncharacterized protein n=1 Tax=Phyllachora maydis TaxID=1825666 RepID=A0AAD9ICX6_9PEZI|nr:hypothetical protein P8C59_009340 [Phyllachora maydis]